MWLLSATNRFTTLKTSSPAVSSLSCRLANAWADGGDRRVERSPGAGDPVVDGPNDAGRWGVESLWSNGKVAGRATGGGYSVKFGQQIAIAYVRPDYAETGQALTIKMLDRHHPAVVVEESPYDPQNQRLRADG